MTPSSKNEFNQFRTDSDKAFRDMQERADWEMASFLQKYGGDAQVGLNSSGSSDLFSSLQTPEPHSSSGVGGSKSPDVAASGGARPAIGSGLYESVSGLDLNSINKSSIQDSVADMKGDLGQLSKNLRDESRAAAREAVKGTSDIIRGSVNDLGRRAKEEAAALKEAARKAREEERNLKAMKGRAAEEARKAKERLRRQAAEAKDDLVGDLKGFAQEKLDSLRGKATDALRTGQESFERELGDLQSGRDS
jgi:hypothetical protein